MVVPRPFAVNTASDPPGRWGSSEKAVVERYARDPGWVTPERPCGTWETGELACRISLERVAGKRASVLFVLVDDRLAEVQITFSASTATLEPVFRQRYGPPTAQRVEVVQTRQGGRLRAAGLRMGRRRGTRRAARAPGLRIVRGARSWLSAICGWRFIVTRTRDMGCD